MDLCLVLSDSFGIRGRGKRDAGEGMVDFEWGAKHGGVCGSSAD